MGKIVVELDVYECGECPYYSGNYCNNLDKDIEEPHEIDPECPYRY